MKYFKDRRRVPRLETPSTTPPTPPAEMHATLEDNVAGDRAEKVGADTNCKRERQLVGDTAVMATEKEVNFTDPPSEKDHHRFCDPLSRARRRRDIRLSRTEVSCLQLLVQNVLNEHLTLSRELQAAHDRLGLPAEAVDCSNPKDLTPLARNVERLQSAIERDAARFKAALRDRDEHLAQSFADARALRAELEETQLKSARETKEHTEAVKVVQTQRDSAVKDAAAKDFIISRLKSELATCQAERHSETETASRDLADKEACIKQFEAQARENTVRIEELRAQLDETTALLESEQTTRLSTEKELTSVQQLRQEEINEHESRSIILSQVMSDQDEDIEDLQKQIEEAKAKFEHDLREADGRFAEMKQNSERVESQKNEEIQKMKNTLKDHQAKVQNLSSELESWRNKFSVHLGELAAARNENGTLRKQIETATRKAESATCQIAELEAKLAQERLKHEKDTAALIAKLQVVSSEAAAAQKDLKTKRVDRNQKAEAEISKLKKELSETCEKLTQAEQHIAIRIPSLESELKNATEDNAFLKGKDCERNTELAESKLMVSQLSEEVTRLRHELEEVKTSAAEKVKSLQAKIEEDASQFRSALHEKDVEIREHQDQRKRLQEEQETLTATHQKALTDLEKQHRSNMANTKTAHQKSGNKFKTELKNRTEEVKRLEENIKTLQAMLSDQKVQHVQEMDKLNLKISSAEKAKLTLEKKLREKEAPLKESESAREKLAQELSRALEKHDGIIKELEDIRKELKRAIADLENEKQISLSLKATLAEAKAETSFALGVVVDFEKIMTAVYADALKYKTEVTDSQLKISEMVQDLKTEKNDYVRLKVRFFKYIVQRTAELQAAGDSLEHEKVEAKHYLHQLQSSKTELESTSEQCQKLQNDLKTAYQQIEDLSAHKNALLQQAEQNKMLLSAAEDEVKTLKRNLDGKNKDIEELKVTLLKRESDLEKFNDDLKREQVKLASLSQSESKSKQQIEQSNKRLKIAEAQVAKLQSNLEHQKCNLRGLETIMTQKTQKSELDLAIADLKKEQAISVSLTRKEAELVDLLKQTEEKLANSEVQVGSLKDIIESQSSRITEVNVLAEKESNIELLSGNLNEEKNSLALSKQRESELLGQTKMSKEMLACALTEIRSPQDKNIEQDKQTREKVAFAEAEIKTLRDHIDQQNGNLKDLSVNLAKKESQIGVLSADLSKTRAELSRPCPECKSVYSLMESSSRNWNAKRLVPDPSAGLTASVDTLLLNIDNLEKELEEVNKRFERAAEENANLKHTLTCKVSVLEAQRSDCYRQEGQLGDMDQMIEKLQNELAPLQEQFSYKESRIAELEKKLADVRSQYDCAITDKVDLKQEPEEAKGQLRNANLSLEQLTSQLKYEKQHNCAQELNLAREQSEKLKMEIHGKTTNIATLSKNLAMLQNQWQIQQKLIEDRANDTLKLQKSLAERDKEVANLTNLLDRVRQECDYRAYHDSADGDGNRDSVPDGLKELNAALAERDADVVNMQAEIASLQNEISLNKSVADNELADYRMKIEELTKEIADLTSTLEREEDDPEVDCGGGKFKLDLHATAEQTMLGGPEDVSRQLPRRRPGAPLKRTASEGNSVREHETNELTVLGTIQAPVTSCGQSCVET